MPIKFNCPGCSKEYSVPDGVGGKSTKCRACGASITIPMTSEAPPAPLAAPSMASSPVSDSSSPRGGFPIKRIALVAVAFLLVVALGYGGWTLLSGGSSPGMKFMPDNTRMLVSVRPADCMKSAVWAEIKKDNPDLDKLITDTLKDAPFQIEDISQILYGVSDISKKEMVIAVEFKKPVKFEDIVTFMEKKGARPDKLTESKIGSYTVKEDGNSSFCQVNTR